MEAYKVHIGSRPDVGLEVSEEKAICVPFLWKGIEKERNANLQT